MDPNENQDQQGQPEQGQQNKQGVIDRTNNLFNNLSNIRGRFGGDGSKAVAQAEKMAIKNAGRQAEKKAAGFVAKQVLQKGILVGLGAVSWEVWAIAAAVILIIIIIVFLIVYFTGQDQTTALLLTPAGPLLA